MTRAVRLGISTCPNDTFAFHALLEGLIDPRGLKFEIELLDVEELNQRLARGEFEVAKGSFHLALLQAHSLGVLPSGSALGFGNGPLLLTRSEGSQPGPESKVLCPGEHTTASLLYRLFHPRAALPEQVPFCEIMPALECGAADFGVCIHEGRFTYREHGLQLVQDLGEQWQEETGAALPLGGILARRDLGQQTLRAVQEVVADSLHYALRHRAQTLPTLRAHAQELSDDVLLAHVDLYVNARTRDLGRQGRSALEALAERARAAGVLPADAPGLQVLGSPRLFHVSAPDEVRRLQAAGGSLQPASLSAQGFVHLSHAPQLPGTLELHFAGAGPLVLLELDAGRVTEHLELEEARDQALFPHLYRAVERADVLRSWPLEGGAGAGDLPALGRDAGQDSPRGTDWA